MNIPIHWNIPLFDTTNVRSIDIHNFSFRKTFSDFMFIYLYLIFHVCHTKKNISRLVAMACSSHCIDDTLYISIFNVVSERLEVSVSGKGSTNIMRKTFSPHATIRGTGWGLGLFTKPMFVIIS